MGVDQEILTEFFLKIKAVLLENGDSLLGIA